MSSLRPLFLLFLLPWMGCQSPSSPEASSSSKPVPDSLLQSYATVSLDTDLQSLTDPQAEMVQHLIEAAQSMDVIFWEQAYGNRDSLLQSIGDPQRRRLAEINYGPWSRLSNFAPFLDGVEPRPPGGNFYPADVTTKELEQAAASTGTIDGPYTMVRRLPDGSLTALSYHQFFAEPVTTAAFQLRDAAQLAESAALRSFLERRADALTTSNYATDLPAQSSALDAVVGPMNTGEDRLLGAKASAVGLVLQRNAEAQQQLNGLVEQLPTLLDTLGDAGASPAEEVPTVGAYDVLYASGAANAGPKPLTLSQLGETPATPGRYFVFPNLVQAHADSLLRPVADGAIAPEQRSHVTADALFDQTAFRELVRSTRSDSVPTADEALDAGATAALGWAMAATSLEESEGARMDAYATGLVTLIHTLHRDTTSVPGRAALLQLNFLQENGAITYDEAAGTYAVAPAAMQEALPDLARRLGALRRADRDERQAFLSAHGSAASSLRTTLARLSDRPVALEFEQGPSVLQGLAPAVIQ